MPGNSLSGLPDLPLPIKKEEMSKKEGEQPDTQVKQKIEEGRRRKTRQKRQGKKDSGVVVTLQLGGQYSHLEFLIETGHLPNGEKSIYPTLSSGHLTAQDCFVLSIHNPASITAVSYDFSHGYQWHSY